MIVRDDPDDWVSEVETRTCPFHQEYPMVRDYPGCSCSSSCSRRKASPEEREANRKRREKREIEAFWRRRKWGW